MSVAGTYECVTKTPMGDQKSDVTIVVDGDTLVTRQERLVMIKSGFVIMFLIYMVNQFYF